MIVNVIICLPAKARVNTDNETSLPPIPLLFSGLDPV